MKKPRASSSSGRSSARPSTFGSAEGAHVVTVPEATYLMHELEVHRVELELQNQELQRTREEREAVLSRYTELFDFAPMGYLTLDLHQSIREVNRVAARILGQHPSQLAGQDFSLHLPKEQRGAFLTLMDQALSAGPARQAAPSLELVLSSGSRILVKASAAASIRPLVLMSFEEVTEQRARETGSIGKQLDIATASGALRGPLASVRAAAAGLEPGDAATMRAQTVLRQRLEALSGRVDALLALMGARTEAVAGPSTRVLIIDDDADVAESLQDALAMAGHVVEIAPDGPQGLERARRFRPAVVICDIGLKGMDGYEVARAFRAEPQLAGAHLIALTGHTQPIHAARAAQAGFDRFVVKPVDLDVLQGLVERPLKDAFGMR